MSETLRGHASWVAEAEEAATRAAAEVRKAYDTYLDAKHHYERIWAVAGNRRAVRDKLTTPFPGIGTEL